MPEESEQKCNKHKTDQLVEKRISFVLMEPLFIIHYVKKIRFALPDVQPHDRLLCRATQAAFLPNVTRLHHSAPSRS